MSSNDSSDAMAHAISGTRKAIKEMADGTLRIQIDIDPRFKQQFHKLFPEIDMPVAIAPLVPVAEGISDVQNSPGGKYGQYAKALRLSAFFRRPEVWMAVGTDQEFLDWLKAQECAYLSNFCNGDIVPAHVRRVANGAGTGIKPQYSAIPLCFQHHSMQHDEGESAIGTREWWDQKRIEYLANWCWETLKHQFDSDSWADVNPIVLKEWAFCNRIETFLPNCYRHYPVKAKVLT